MTPTVGDDVAKTVGDDVAKTVVDELDEVHGAQHDDEESGRLRRSRQQRVDRVLRPEIVERLDAGVDENKTERYPRHVRYAP